ncbi:peptide ABC transporter membrane spanning protein [Corynebacterium suranareeae]|uniref:Peptide ABC transporter membrane spanning protein n=2 Tax=Corynebacterium suranareeae TaxID=2506452 RepID=A0A160PPD4_9CORY|nr:peptide ABC transporter membrane spanning protein [Corynebacterium suranareeae]
MRNQYLKFAGRRIAQAILVVVLAYIATFLIITILPGDPITTRLQSPESGLSDQEIAVLVSYYGLDQPIVVQLWESFSRFIVGDFGISLSSSLPVSGIIKEAILSTLSLAGVALVVAITLAFLIAIGSQLVPKRYGQGLIRAFPSLFLSVPNFIIGLLLINIFAFSLGWFRIINPETPFATFLAALALGIPVSAQLAEVLITNLDQQANQEYASVVKSRGANKLSLVFRHLLKPASLPAITVLALTVGELLGGSVITEMVFGRQGIGAVIERSVASQDFPVLQAVVSLSAVIFVLANLLADLMYPLLDPRVKLRQETKKKPKITELEVAVS